MTGEIYRTMMALTQAYDRLDEGGADTRKASDMLFDQIEECTDRLSYHRPADAAEAALMAGAAFILINIGHSSVFYSQEWQREMEQRAERLVGRVLRFLEAQAGQSLQEAGLGYYGLCEHLGEKLYIDNVLELSDRKSAA